MSKTHLTTEKFAQMGLEPEVLAGLESKGFHYCTPIQALSLLLLVEGHDLAGQAQTGTGKTLAFLAATFNYLLTHPLTRPRLINQPRAIIMAPTRELAVQIYNDAESMSASTGLKLGLAYGGEGYDKQLAVLEQGVDILIGTTGRIIDYFKSKVIDLSNIQVVVLDEADRMFDLGFIKDIRFLFRRMPPATERLSMLFSATLSLRVQELAYEHMNHPEHVQVEPEQMTGVRIKEELFYPSNEDKMLLLLSLMEEEWPEKAIVFANTKHVCEDVHAWLENDGHRVGLLTGDVPQKKRMKILEEFTKGTLDILVATDVAARGLDIDELPFVINFELPHTAEDYVHRIGRTGRAGHHGYAISLVSSEEKHWLSEIEKLIKLQIPQERVPGFDPDPDFHEAGSRGHRGRRPAAAAADTEAQAPAARSGGRERGVERSAEARREPAREREGLRAGPRRGRSSVAADGFDFSKPYEPLNPPVAVAEQTQPTVAAADKPDPLRRHQRPIAVLLGGLGRK